MHEAPDRDAIETLRRDTERDRGRRWIRDIRRRLDPLATPREETPR